MATSARSNAKPITAESTFLALVGLELTTLGGLAVSCVAAAKPVRTDLPQVARPARRLPTGIWRICRFRLDSRREAEIQIAEIEAGDADVEITLEEGLKLRLEQCIFPFG